MADNPKASKTIESASTTEKIEGSKTGRSSTSDQLRTATSSKIGQAGSIAASVQIGQMSAVAEFSSALSNCIQQFGPLGTWIKNQVKAQFQHLAETLNIPKLYKEFQELSPIMKVFVVIGILGALSLVQWISWKVVSFIWGHLKKFIESENGQKCLKGFTGFLQSLTGSNVVSSFSAMFKDAAETSENQKGTTGKKFAGRRKKPASDSEASDDDDSKGVVSQKEPEGTEGMFEDLKRESKFSKSVVEIMSGFFASFAYMPK